jgi:hypothetical protein
VNYIFHKLSVNTKHVQLLKIGIKFIFPVFSKELLHASMWLKLPKDWRAGFSKNSLFCPYNLGFSLFFHFLFFLLMVLHDVTFNVPATIWMWSFWFFSRILISPQCWSLESRPPSTKIILAHSYLQIWSCNLSHVCATQFRSDVQKTQKKKKHLIFINFGVKKCTLKSTQKKKTLMFECYNLLDPMEWGVVIFEGWCSTR